MSPDPICIVGWNVTLSILLFFMKFDWKENLNEYGIRLGTKLYSETKETFNLF